VGTIRRQLLSDMAVCKLYQEGFSRTEIGWKARLYDSEILVILRNNGVALRNSSESQALARSRRLERERLRARV
jgi:hypothetical protein